ncbi:helix-turn-helix domain-containing protein [Nonomuraea antimicrobica]
MKATTGSTGSGGSPAVHKAARILFELAAHPEPTSPAELSRRLSIPKSSLADLCATLVETGMLVRDLEGRMRLGPRLP